MSDGYQVFDNADNGFYRILDSEIIANNDNFKIAFLLNQNALGCPFTLFPQPDSILQRFYITKFNKHTITDESIIVSAFIKCFGTRIICRESTFCLKKPTTIIDDLNADWDSIDNNYRKFKLYHEFIKQGVYPASQYNELDLYKDYCKCLHYFNTKNLGDIFPIHNKVIKIQKWYKRNKLYRKLFLVAEVMFQEQMHPESRYMQNYIKTLEL
jgi:hypothetical protein